ncbi:T9SS type A sorting domain-containing protein [Bacteroidota bacterium]
MKKITSLLFLLVFSIVLVSAQESDLEKWNKLPELDVLSSSSLKSVNNLPYMRSNFSTNYFRPLFNQNGMSCNQAGSVGYLLTYELNAKRDLPGNVPENQYVPFFVYNFLNKGSAVNGVSYFDSWEIVKSLGCASFSDFPNTNNDKRWMDGYDRYYSAMHNKIYENYSIDVSSPEGLEKLKGWINDHNNGDKVGGLANIQIGSGFMDYRRIPDGTEKGGKQVIVQFSPQVGHCLTIVGYNDSIRYDLNNDQKYTNDVDINGDGKVTMADWEIGAVQFVNSWGTHDEQYILYKVLGDKIANGGIWGNSVHVVKVNAFYKPLLTMKVKLKHNKRNMLKINAGFAFDKSATEPEYIEEFPFFNYQGGPYPMQGGNTIEDETIEIGLDITSLLARIAPGTDVKYFLVIDENDSNSTGNGEVISFSVIDYQYGVDEVECQKKNYEIVNNGTTLLSVDKIVDFNKLTIETTALPPAMPFEQYDYQMVATGGTPEYTWKLDINYDENHFEEVFPEINSDPIINTTSDGLVEIDLDFDFPFYGEYYDKLYVKSNGIVAFNRGFAKYPYMVNPDLLFKTRKYIQLFGTNISIKPENSDFVKFEGDENSACFVWNASVTSGGNTADVNIALKIYPSGEMKFYYGAIDMEIIPWKNDWLAGFSNGDYVHNIIARVSDSEFLFEDYVAKFTPAQYPSGFELSESGLFSCIPDSSGGIINLNVLVTDANNISQSQVVSFSTYDWEEDIIMNQNWPNPFTNSTRIDFLLRRQGDVTIEIFDMSWRKVKTLLNQNLLAGEHSFVWRAYGKNDLPVKTGIYFYQLRQGNTVITKKMFKIK